MEKVPVKQSQVCGLWELKEQLGTGGFGHVYLYQHLVSPDHVTTHIHIKASGDESLKQHYLLRCSAGMQRVLCVVCVCEGDIREDSSEIVSSGAELKEQRTLE